MRRESPEVERLAKFIDLTARRCWRGLPALLGKAPKPTREQLKQAFYYRPTPDDLGVKVQGGRVSEGRDIALADSFMDDFDPIFEGTDWNDIVEGVKWFSQSHKPEWSIYLEFVVGKETGRARWNGEGTAERLARKYDMTPAGVYDIVRETPRKIARAISFGCFDLLLKDF